MDFVFGALFDGRRFRVSTLVDHFSRVSPAIEVGSSITGKRVAGVPDRLAGTHGLPQVGPTDNGAEYTSRAVDEWAHRNGSYPGPRGRELAKPRIGPKMG